MKSACIGFALLAVSSIAFAQTDASEWPAKRHVDCDGGTPAALLDGSAYREYRAAPGSGTYYESIALDGGAHLRIDNGSCSDPERTQFLLTVPQPDHDQTDFNYWAGYLDRVLAELKTRSNAADVVASMRNFLLKAPAYAANGGRIQACRDGSDPVAGECAPASGGEFRFEIKKTGGTLVVSATQSGAISSPASDPVVRIIR